ncbi:hypothetical protein KC366_g90 [Hortaea werneckii]|nr:hypothetical protein KC366_g90 [Hortaea werneckii]
MKLVRGRTSCCNTRQIHLPFSARKGSRIEIYQTSSIPFKLASEPRNHLPFSSNSSPAPPAPPPSLLRLPSCASCTVLIFRACIGRRASTVGCSGRFSEGLEDLGWAADCRSVIMRSRLAISEGRVSS